MKLTQKTLKVLLHYNPHTGAFTWRVYRGGRAKAGTLAGSLADNGYITISVLSRVYSAHRLAWFYMTGAWPKLKIDHKDRKRSNNRWRNLRLATAQQNQHNRSKQHNNVSGYTGVTWNKRCQKWQAQITVDNERKYLGVFDDVTDAAKAYSKAKAIWHG